MIICNAKYTVRKIERLFAAVIEETTKSKKDNHRG